MLACADVEQLLSDYEDGALPFATRVAVRLHLMMCRSCRSLERSLQTTLDLLHGLGDEPVDDTVQRRTPLR